MDRFAEGCFWATLRVLEYVIEIGTSLFILWEALRYLGVIKPWM